MTTTPRILLLERDSELAAVLDRVLTGHGYEVAVAHGGDEALRLARAEPPAVAVVDAGQLATLRALRSLPGWAELPAVVLVDGNHGALPRGDWALRRPFDFAALLDLIEGALVRAEPVRAVARARPIVQAAVRAPAPNSMSR
ncbi:MAG TPA: hypothetical protein VGB85_14490 [Nannocystis sp.]